MSVLYASAAPLLFLLPFLAQEISESKTLTGGLSPGGKAKYQALTKFIRYKDRPSETHITDQVMNYETDSGFPFQRNINPKTTVFAGKVPSAVEVNGKVVPAILSQQWNTFRSVKSQVGQVFLNPDNPKVRSSGFTCLIYRAGTNPGKAVKGAELYGKLILGDEKGKALLTASSTIQDDAGSFAYKYIVSNLTNVPVEFEWAGFKEKLEPGKSFSRTLKSAKLTAEVSETAAISFKDGSRFTITANVWQRPE